jgi:hypothetical protein
VRKWRRGARSAPSPSAQWRSTTPCSTRAERLGGTRWLRAGSRVTCSGRRGRCTADALRR